MEKAFESITHVRTLTRQEFEKICSDHVKSIFLGDHLLLCKILGRYKIYLDSRDMGVAPNILMDGFWESWITKFIIHQVNPGDVCIDAGANFGYYSLLLAELAGKSGKTVAVEPNAYLSKLLSFTNNVNDDHFIIQQKALSDEPGELTLSVPLHFWGGGTIRKEKVDDHITTEMVQVETFDNMVKQLDLPKVDFIKMDCEGVEPQIFQGMKNTLEKNPQLKMVMEYSPFMYKDPRDFTEFIFSRFKVGEITGESTVREFSEKDINYLVNLRDHIDLFLQTKSSS
jgi:FkbM family methyltransferase